MSNLDTRFFPYSNIEITIVRKDDILKTIDDNIIDKDVANELISHLETRAEKSLMNHKWTGFPFLGSIRVPPGLSPETLQRTKDATMWARDNMSREAYVMFTKQCAHDAYQINKYRAYFDTIKTRAINNNRTEYHTLCSLKGKNYATCKITFSNNLKPMKQEYEYWYEMNENNDTEQTDD